MWVSFFVDGAEVRRLVWDAVPRKTEKVWFDGNQYAVDDVFHLIDSRIIRVYLTKIEEV